MSCSPNFLSIQKAVIQVLFAPGLDSILCSFEQLIVPLHLSRDGIYNDALVHIDQSLLVAVFISGGVKEHIFPYECIGFSNGGRDTQHFLLIRITLVVGKRQKVYEVGRFSMDADDGKLFMTSSNIIPSACAHNDIICHPLAQPSIKK